MYSVDMIPRPRTVPLVDGALSIQYRWKSDISHVVLVFLVVVILLVFRNGYMGEYMVAVAWM